MLKNKPSRTAPPSQRTVLVLQGGGALCACQLGVYQALHATTSLRPARCSLPFDPADWLLPHDELEAVIEHKLEREQG